MPPADTDSALYLDKTRCCRPLCSTKYRLEGDCPRYRGRKLPSLSDRIYLLQISTRDRSAIIDPLPIGPRQARRLLQSKAVEVCLSRRDYDLRCA